MKKGILLLLLSVWSFIISAQTVQDNHKIIGEFVTAYRNQIIYKTNEYVASEYANYTLYSLDINTMQHTQLDVLSINISPNLDHDSIVYVKDNSIVKMSLDTREKSVYECFSNQFQLIGVGYNLATQNLLALLLDYSKNEINMKLYDDRKIVFFDDSFAINAVTMEAVSPIIYSVSDWLVFKSLKELIQIDCHNLTFNYISQNCMDYALTEEEVIFYTYVNNRSYGFIYNLDSRAIASINDAMGEHIKACTNSLLYTSTIDSIYYPIYNICGSPFIWKDQKWNEESQSICYENELIEITLPNEENLSQPTFYWKLKE